MVKVKIERYSDQLEGIGHVNGKIIFVPKVKVGDIIDVDIVEEKSKYLRGKLVSSSNKVDCPYFYECGGCQLRHMTYDETLSLKLGNLQKLLKSKDIYNGKINLYDNKCHYNYRNKISLKIVNKKIGYYHEKTNNLVEIDNCLIAKDAINKFIPELSKLNIKNGAVTIRCNFNDELLISISTEDEVSYDFELFKEDHKVAGIVINGKPVLNDNFIIDKINNTLFKISYDSFFQINNAGASSIVEIIKNNVDKNDDVLDLYCGVGTLGLSIANDVNSIVGVEIVPNAIQNALDNAKMNNIENTNFILGDVSKSLDKIKASFNTIIFDPPRSGLDEATRKFVFDTKPNKVIYVSCNPVTLVRDLEELKEIYNIKDVSMIDMFSFSYHVETVCVLERK